VKKEFFTGGPPLLPSLFSKAPVIPKKENQSLRGFDDGGIPISYCTTYIAEDSYFVLTIPMLSMAQNRHQSGKNQFYYSFITHIQDFIKLNRTNFAGRHKSGMDEATYKMLLQKAIDNGYDVKSIIRVEQDCN
jgi:hypothetical protein